jgi:ferrochelatase
MDPRVIDLPKALRMLLVFGVILPFRPKKSAAAYRKIWTELGSPLLVHSLRLREKVKTALKSAPVELGMRYGSPSLSDALGKLLAEGVTHLRVIPLYPQFSLASTQSALDQLDKILPESLKEKTEVKMDFFQEPGFIRAFVNLGQKWISDFKPDHILFSFHGIPERHVKKTDLSGATCLPETQNQYGKCCETLSSQNRYCYRAQCFATARAIATELSLSQAQYSVSFQSRLGRTPWIKPFTDLRYGELARSGVKRLLVFSPSFVADCLETLEEIQIRGLEQFQAEGGEELKLVPSLNDGDVFSDTLATWFFDESEHSQAKGPRHFIPLSQALKPFGGIS